MLLSVCPPPVRVGHRLAEQDAAGLDRLPSDCRVEVRQLGGQDLQEDGESLDVRLVGEAGCHSPSEMLAQPFRGAED
jgi:hypothetical protein